MAARGGKSNKGVKNLKFEEAMERLDAIVAAMESGEIGIEESLAKYEEAMQLAGHCRDILTKAEQRIQQIQVDAGGQLRKQPFNAGAAAAPPAPPDGEPDEEG
jgi:exodeoxyribonuclease VII small subunit